MMLQIQLSEELSEEFKRTIEEAYKSAIEQSRKDASVNVEYLSKQQTMELYGISNNTLMTEWVSKGLSYFKIGNKIYFKRKEINNFIELHKIY